MTSLKESYERWVRSEQKWLLPLLDTARNLTLFLPGRFSDTELRSEARQPTLTHPIAHFQHPPHSAFPHVHLLPVS